MNRKYDNLLQIAIMAHNEEKIISRAIESCFKQNCPQGFLINVLVVANGCSDRTEEIVSGMMNKYNNMIELITLEKKGKTIALNKAIEYIEYKVQNGRNIHYVVFMDADCEFYGNEALCKFINKFQEIPLICAVGAECVPNIIHLPGKNLISDMYMATKELSNLLVENGISGGAYCIKTDSYTH
ncbi:MAG: glycosyltransferase family 2 protein, partial [Sedimentibacter sp.]|nr:glycosyltransferase family 2 protein [Sedimentibacter sp.]